MFFCIVNSRHSPALLQLLMAVHVGAISWIKVPIIVPRMVSFLSPLMYLITGNRLNFSSPLRTEQGGISRHSWPSFVVVSYQLYTAQTSCCWCLQFHFITSCLAVSHQCHDLLVHHCTLLRFVLILERTNNPSSNLWQEKLTTNSNPHADSSDRPNSVSFSDFGIRRQFPGGAA